MNEVTTLEELPGVRWKWQGFERPALKVQDDIKKDDQPKEEAKKEEL